MKIIDTKYDLDFVYNKKNELIGIVLMTIYEDLLDDYLVKILEINSLEYANKLKEKLYEKWLIYRYEPEELKEEYDNIIYKFPYYSIKFIEK